MNIFFNWFVIESVPKILFHIQQDLHTVQYFSQEGTKFT